MVAAKRMTATDDSNAFARNPEPVYPKFGPLSKRYKPTQNSVGILRRSEEPRNLLVDIICEVPCCGTPLVKTT